jgi:hypothetical protein
LNENSGRGLVGICARKFIKEFLFPLRVPSAPSVWMRYPSQGEKARAELLAHLENGIFLVLVWQSQTLEKSMPGDEVIHARQILRTFEKDGAERPKLIKRGIPEILSPLIILIFPDLVCGDQLGVGYSSFYIHFYHRGSFRPACTDRVQAFRNRAHALTNRAQAFSNRA